MSGEVAQTVEQRPEKPCVPSSILGLATIFLSSYFHTEKTSTLHYFSLSSAPHKIILYTKCLSVKLTHHGFIQL